MPLVYTNKSGFLNNRGKVRIEAEVVPVNVLHCSKVVQLVLALLIFLRCACLTFNRGLSLLDLATTVTTLLPKAPALPYPSHQIASNLMSCLSWTQTLVDRRCTASASVPSSALKITPFAVEISVFSGIAW